MDKRVFGDLPDIIAEGKENEDGTQRKNEPGSKKVFISVKETAQASKKIEIMVGSLPIRSRGRGKSSSDSCSSAAEEATSRSRISSNSSTQWRIGDERRLGAIDQKHVRSRLVSSSIIEHEEAASDESAAEKQLFAAEALQDDKDNDTDSDPFSEESDLVNQLRLRKFLRNSCNFDSKKTNFKHAITLTIILAHPSDMKPSHLWQTNLEICGGSLMLSTITLNHSFTHPLQPPSPISSQGAAISILTVKK